MIPTARSSTLPRITNALNSFSIEPFPGEVGEDIPKMVSLRKVVVP
jgi:hypothetical protein